MIFEINSDPTVASALCAPEVKVTEFLFGKDVGKLPSKAKTMVDLEESFGRPKHTRGGCMPLSPLADLSKLSQTSVSLIGKRSC